MPTQPILLTPGPVRTPPLVTEYLAHPPCNYHRQDAFSTMFAETERELKHFVGIQRPDDYFATVATTTGTGANEACLLALQPLGKGLICNNGFFGARVVDQAQANQIDHAVFEAPNDRPLDPAAIVAALDKDPAIKWVFFVTHETRTGLVNPFEAIGAACKARGLFVGADAISSAFAYKIDIEASQADLVTASSAKAIMAAPGLGIIFTKLASVAALDAAAATTPRRGYYHDILAELKKQRAERQPRFAQPVCLHAALRAACTYLSWQGIDAHMARIQRQMRMLIDHLATIGVEPLLDAKFRSNIAVNFRLPVGMPYKQFSARMEELGFYCLYGVPGDSTHFQLSTIGYLSDDEIRSVQTALTTVLAG